MEPTTTGITGLDAQLNGGIPRGTSLLLLSQPGNALSAFSEQFAAGGLHGGEDVHVFEFDRPATGIRERITGLARNGTEPKGSFHLYDGYSAQFGASGGVSDATLVKPSDAPSTILQAIQGASPDRPFRVVIESLSALVTRDNQREILQFVKHLAFLAREVGGTVLIAMVQGLHDPTFETHLQHLVSGVLEMGIEKKGFGLYSFLMVKKLLDVPDPVRLLLFKETDKGLWLESTKRVF